MLYSSSLAMAEDMDKIAFDNLELRRAMSKKEIKEDASKKKLATDIKVG